MVKPRSPRQKVNASEGWALALSSKLKVKKKVILWSCRSCRSRAWNEVVELLDYD